MIGFTRDLASFLILKFAASILLGRFSVSFIFELSKKSLELRKGRAKTGIKPDLTNIFNKPKR